MFIHLRCRFGLSLLFPLILLGCNIKFLEVNSFICSSSSYTFAKALKTSAEQPGRSFLTSLYNCFNGSGDSIHTRNRNTLYRNGSSSPNVIGSPSSPYAFVTYSPLSPVKGLRLPSPNRIVVRPSSDAPVYEAGSNSRGLPRLYLFRALKDWFYDEFMGWYVPPMPTGERVSYKLHKLGPLQSETETSKFLDLIGAKSTDNIYTVMQKYYYVLNNTSKATHEPLKNTCKDYLRKMFIYALEEMESEAAKGPRAWREFWKPPSDENGNFVDMSEFTPEDLQFISWWPDFVNMEGVLRDIKKERKRKRVIDPRKFRGLVRITKDFKGRVYKCMVTMLPLMALGLVPQFGSFSVALSSMMACRIMYKGDPKEPDDPFLNTSQYIQSTEYDRSETTKSVVTLAVVASHSMLGYLISKLVESYTKLGTILSKEMLSSFFVNTQLTLSALLYDTSEMSYKEKVELSNRDQKPVKTPPEFVKS